MVRPMTGHRVLRVVAPGALALVLVVMCLLSMRTGMFDDDWTMSVVLSGSLPGQGLTLFLNAALSQLLFLLGQVSPEPAWFGLVSAASVFCALWALGWACLSLMPVGPGVFLWAAVAFLFLPNCTYAPNFTFTASLCTLAGIVLVAGACHGGLRRRPVLGVAGTLLCCLGLCWRFESFLLGLPFLALAVVWPWLMDIARRPRPRGNHAARAASCKEASGGLTAHRSDGTVVGYVHAFAMTPAPEVTAPAAPPRLRRLFLAPLALVVVCLAALTVYDRVMWAQEPWASWERYNNARAEISDYPMPTYAQAADRIAALGLSENDYWLVTHWITLDPTFDVETMEGVAELRQEPGLIEAALHGVSKYAHVVMGQHPPYALAVGIVVLAGAFALARDWRTRTAVLLAALLALAACCLFAGLGRLPDRVERPIWAYASVAALYVVGCAAAWGHSAACFSRGGASLGDADAPAFPGAHASARSRRTRHGLLSRLAGGVALALGCVGVVWIAAFAVFVAPSVDLGRARALVDQSAFEPQGELVSYVQAHPELTLAWTPAAMLSLELSYDLRFTPDASLLARTVPLGGWTVGAPYTAARNDAAGLATPLRDLVDNPGARLVVRGEPEKRELETLTAFVREHYAPDAQAVVEAELYDTPTKAYVQVVRLTSDSADSDPDAQLPVDTPEASAMPTGDEPTAQTTGDPTA